MTYLDAITIRTTDHRDPEEMLRWYRARIEAFQRHAGLPAYLRIARVDPSDVCDAQAR